eukprot:gene13202-9048_t
MHPNNLPTPSETAYKCVTKAINIRYTNKSKHHIPTTPNYLLRANNPGRLVTSTYHTKSNLKQPRMLQRLQFITKHTSQNITHALKQTHNLLVPQLQLFKPEAPQQNPTQSNTKKAVTSNKQTHYKTYVEATVN